MTRAEPFPAAARITTRTEASLAIASSSAWIAEIIWLDSGLNRSGRFSVRVATPFATVERTNGWVAAKVASARILSVSVTLTNREDSRQSWALCKSSDAVPSTTKRNTARNQAVFVGLPFQVFAKIGMGERNDRLSPFCHALALQIGHAELGDHIHHVRARRGHDVAGASDQARCGCGALLASRKWTKGR